jgi:hypothetical protein
MGSPKGVAGQGEGLLLFMVLLIVVPPLHGGNPLINMR